MSDLTNDELRARLEHALGERALYCFVEPLRELQRRRAEAVAALHDKARLYSVVSDAVREMAGIGQWPPPLELCSAIANRVVSQVSAPTTAPAETASKERVREVVRRELNEHCMWADDINGEDTFAIADRVAEQIAAPADADVVNMRLCETRFLALKPGQLYRFDVAPGCQQCADAATEAAMPGRLTAPSTRPRQRKQDASADYCDGWNDALDAAGRGSTVTAPVRLSEDDRRALTDARRCIEEHCTSVDGSDTHHLAALATIDRLIGGSR